MACVKTAVKGTGKPVDYNEQQASVLLSVMRNGVKSTQSPRFKLSTTNFLVVCFTFNSCGQNREQGLFP